MISRAIAQAVVGDGGLLARSHDFDEAWAADVDRIAAGYGLPPGASAPESLFVVPFGKRRIAVVSVAGRRFRFLVLSRALWEAIPDPFAIVERFPPRWDGPLDTLEWPLEPLPKRTVGQLDHIFKHGDGPFLLGACQTLVDGGRIVLQRVEPALAIGRDVWNLLPQSTRRHTWVATYAYSVALEFNLVAMPTVPSAGLTGYLTEDQARDYPESRYERELQTAVEAGEQASVDRLLARRTSSETLRLAVWLVLGAFGLAVAARLLAG